LKLEREYAAVESVIRLACLVFVLLLRTIKLVHKICVLFDF